MKRIQTLIALALLVSTIVVFFYSTMRLEATHSLMGASEVLMRHPNRQVYNSDVIISEQEPVTMPCPTVHTLPVSDKLRKTISQNGAYWNRMLYRGLGNMQKEGNPISLRCDWSHCKEIKQEPLKINVHDFSAYPPLFQEFLLGMNCRSPPVLIHQPNKCIPDKGNANETFLLFAIKSTPGNFEQRQALRETWGQKRLFQSGFKLDIMFLLGSSSLDDPDLSSLLSFEARHYKDLLQWDFNESFFNLTLKMNAFLQWTLKHCPHVSFIFSGDDDVFVNTPALVSYLQSLEPSKASQLYVGQVISTASPIRDPKNKYYVPQSFFDSLYPPYAGGGGFLISGALLEPLYSVSQVVPFFPIDDVYIAMCLMALGVSPEEHNGIRTFDVKEEDRENLCTYKDLILIHQRSPQQIKKLWKGIHSPLLTC